MTQLQTLCKMFTMFYQSQVALLDQIACLTDHAKRSRRNLAKVEDANVGLAFSIHKKDARIAHFQANTTKSEADLLQINQDLEAEIKNCRSRIRLDEQTMFSAEQNRSKAEQVARDERYHREELEREHHALLRRLEECMSEVDGLKQQAVSYGLLEQPSTADFRRKPLSPSVNRTRSQMTKHIYRRFG